MTARGKLGRGRRARRTKAEVNRLKEEISAVLVEDHPMTVRQVFYRLVSRGTIDKREQEYKNTVCRLLGVMRREEMIPYAWIADNTRWMRKPRTHSSLEQALRDTAQHYRRALWDTQDAYVEVWCEKDALAGVILEETRPWDVPLMVSRGFSSITYLYEAAEQIREADKPAFLYYFGDHDPSGIHIDRSIKRQLEGLAPDAEIHFERVAVLPEQIEELDLPTRPTKGSDSRAKGFKGGSVELDAIPPADLRALVHERIMAHVDEDKLEVLRVAEESERDILLGISEQVAKDWPGDE
jgi:hypothetical protein